MILQKWVFKIGLIISVSVLFLHAQSKSAIEFYDTTGVTPTAKFGWTGDAGTGKFFITTPGDANGVSVKAGNVTATKFTGDGSGLTGVTAAAPTVAGVVGLKDSLGRKADTATVMPLIRAAGAGGVTAQVLSDSLKRKADTTWVNGKVGGKADTGWVRSQIPASLNFSGVAYYIQPDGGDVVPPNMTNQDMTGGSVKTVVITMNIPYSGFVIVNATARIAWDYQASSGGYYVDGSISTSKVLSSINYAVFGSFGQAMTWSQTIGFPVNAGINTFYLMLQNKGGASVGIFNQTITAFFSKNKLN